MCYENVMCLCLKLWLCGIRPYERAERGNKVVCIMNSDAVEEM